MATRIRAELSVVVWSGATFAALLASSSALRPVRDAVILDGNLDQIPLAFVGTFCAVSVASSLWSKLLADHRRRRFAPLAFHAFAVCAVGFACAVRSGVAPIAVGRVFYVWQAVFNLFVVSVFWSLLADLLGPAAARRLYGPIAAGGSIGTLIGPTLTRLFVGSIGITGVLVLSAVLLELAVIGARRLPRAATRLTPEAAAPDVPAGGGAFTGIVHVARSRYLSAIVGYVLCTGCAATFVYLLRGRIGQELLPDRTARVSYFASLDLWTALATLPVQMFIAGPALRRLGPGLVLCALPLIQAACVPVLATAPSLSALAAVQIISGAATHGLTRPARELLFTVISSDDKYRAKHAIDTIAYRFGDMSSSWIYLGLFAIGTAALVGAMIPLVAGWLVLAAVLGAGFAARAARASKPSTAPATSTHTAPPPPATAYIEPATHVPSEPTEERT